MLNDDYHLALKLKLQGLQQRVRALQPPRRRDAPATVLHEGSLAEAGMRPDAKTKIDDVCRAWAEDTGEPFVTLVARRGVIVTHEAFGRDPSGQPITRDYRCWVASITKTVTALLFSQFVDQHLLGLGRFAVRGLSRLSARTIPTCPRSGSASTTRAAWRDTATSAACAIRTWRTSS